MFFIMGAGQDQKVLPFDQIMLCKCCGKFGHIQIIMTYSYFSFFFIPLFKWNRHYYVHTSCCGTLYELDPEVGKAIARGEQIEILPQHLRLVNRGGYSRGVKRCSNCGYETAEDFEFCPKCGMRF